MSNNLNSILAALRQQSDHERIVGILTKPSKTKEDAKDLFDKIQGFVFFKNFFDHYIQDMDMHSILTLCQTFNYEKFEANSLVFKQKDPSNDKFYVIISGEVAVIIKNDNIGKFGDLDKEKKDQDTPSSVKSVSFLGKTTKNQKKKTFSVLIQSDRKRVSRSQSKRHHSQVKETLHAPLPYKKSIFSKKNQDEDELISKTRRSFNKPSHEFLNLEKLPEPLEMPKRSESDNKALMSSSSSLKKLYAMIDENEIGSVIKKSNDPKDLLSQGSSLAFLEDEDHKSHETSEVLSQTIKTEGDEDSFFEILASGYGKVVRYLKEGEGFGEIALKRNIPRTATILCKTACEFLVIDKKQYELGFWKMQREKEEILNSVFPMLKTNVSSTLNYNYLLYSFKTERLTKGNYLIKEGKAAEKEPKFYVIQLGECLIEKKLIKTVTDPFNPRKTIIVNQDNVSIAVAGKGVVVGEEVLITGDEYEYSIKILSDVVMVQSIIKKEFEQRFPKEFQKYFKELYEKKKMHRESVFEQIKKDSEHKSEQYKQENLYSLKNKDIRDFVTQPAIQGFSRHLNRESKILDGISPSLTEVHAQTNNQLKNYIPSQRRATVSTYNRTFQTGHDSIELNSPAFDESEHKNERRLARFGVPESDSAKLLSKIAFLDRLTKDDKKHSKPEESNNDHYIIQDKKTNQVKAIIHRTSPKIDSARLIEDRLHIQVPHERMATDPDEKVVNKPTIKIQQPQYTNTRFKTEEVQPASVKGDNRPKLISPRGAIGLKKNKIFKGSVNLKRISSPTAIYCSPSINSVRDSTTKTKIASQDFSDKDLLNPNLITESKQSRPASSLNNLQVITPRLNSEPDENLGQYAGSLNNLPTYWDRNRIKSVTSIATPNQNGRKGSTALVTATSFAPNFKKSGQSSQNNMYSNLLKVDDWRKKIFKKVTIK